MNPEMIELAKRAVACKGWRWMPGMRAVGKYPSYPVRIHDFGENIQDIDDMLAADKWLPWQQPVEYGDHVYDGPYLPDLTDPATLGCLLALVREAYRDPSKLWEGHVEVRRDHRILFFVVSFRHDASGALIEDTLATGATEAEALVAALESK